jgi:hypothetical protein
MSTPTVHTFYQSNIPTRMVEAQARVFTHLDIPLKQWKDDKTTHCEWINTVMRDESLGPLTIIADIDAFPLSRAGFDRLVAQASGGAVAGLAQVANHKDPSRIYAAPMFLAVQRSVDNTLGAPSMCRTKTGDVAQILTDRAQEAGVEVALTYPAFSELPRWPLADYGMYGIGSFYGENAFFHLFEARRTQTQDLFCAVAEGVIAGRHNWQRYLEIMEQAPPPAKKKKFFGLF